MTLWHTVFIIGALLIVGRGLHGGIEKAVKILMPSLFVMLIVMSFATPPVKPRTEAAVVEEEQTTN